MPNENEQNRDSLQELIDAVTAGDAAQSTSLLASMHPADISHLLESTTAENRDFIWPLLPPGSEGEVLLHLNDELRASFIGKMDADTLRLAAENLDTDDLADIIPEMPLNVTQELLLTMEAHERERLRSVLAYPEDTAGGLMDPDTIMVREDISLDVVLRYLRRRGEIPEGTDKLFVVDREDHYLGILPLSRLLTNDPGAHVAAVMDKEIQAIPAEMPAQDVAKMFERHDLITAPVVDVENRLLGRITIDDVVDVIRDTADHSFMSMAGLNEEEDMFAPVLASTRRRSLWLGVNLLTALMASSVIGLFDTTIEKIVALAVLMPIVASMGGIAGSQTLTLAIRGLALGQITEANTRWLAFKEIAISVINGIVWALVVGLIAWLWFGKLGIALILGAAMIINLLIAAASGLVIPLILHRLGIDPALSGSVVLTTVTDVVGFTSFLGLATLFLL